MKNSRLSIYLTLILRQGVLLLALLPVVSCDPDVGGALPEEDAKFNVRFNNGVLHFPSIDSYSSLVESAGVREKADFVRFLNEKSDYISLRKTVGRTAGSNARTFSSNELQIIEDNEFLGSILNSDGLLGIGEHIFKISIANQKVYVLESKYQDQVEDLRMLNLENKNIIVFSTEDDVLDLLAEGVRGTTGGRVQLFCRESRADDFKDPDFDNSPFNDFYRHDNKVVYQAYGVYFSLQAKTKVQYRGWTGIWGAGGFISDQRIDYHVKFKPRCRAIVEHWGIREDDGTSHELNYRPYESTRALHAYRYEAVFYGAGFWSRLYRIADVY